MRENFTAQSETSWVEGGTHSINQWNSQWLLQHITHTAHSSGTCKMGPTAAALAVVDQYCRVHGLEDLRVVDASVESHYKQHLANLRRKDLLPRLRNGYSIC